MAKNQLDRSQDSQTYLYDTAQRFTKMERGTIGGTPSFYQGYTLDALANWSSFNNNGTTESRTHDVMNAITARGATSLSHDLNGNLTNDGNQKYIWDELNRLVEVRDSGNNIICDYYYNADNLRVEKHHAGGAKEQFYYDGATVLVETDGSQTKVREYVNGGQYIDEVILVVNGSTYNYYMSDLRYCVTGFLDSSGNVVERARYDGYGKRTLLDASYATITTANVDQSYGYTGIRHDNESGLQYYRARYFDNDLGRFVNHDPLEYIDGMNLFRGYFVVNYLDSNGLWKDKGNNIWEAEKGDSLSGLANKSLHGGRSANWPCLWPVQDTKDHGYPDKIKECDKYDASNLVDPTPNSTTLKVNVDISDQTNWVSVFGALEAIQGDKVAEKVKSISGEGASPIKEFMVTGHSGSNGMMGVVNGVPNRFTTAGLIALDKPPSFTRAKNKQGPVKCWFTRKAIARFPGCKSNKVMAKPFAKQVLRKGAYSYGADRIIGVSGGVFYWNYNEKKGVFKSHGDWKKAPVWDKYSGKQ